MQILNHTVPQRFSANMIYSIILLIIGISAPSSSISDNYNFGNPPITLGRYSPSQDYYEKPLSSYGVALGSVPAFTLPALRKVDYNQNEYNSADSSSNGQQGQSGYKSNNQFEEGAAGQHLNEGDKAYYNKNGGNQAKNLEIGGHYGFNKQQLDGVKGASFEETSGGKKGSKTVGFHKVYHKDEYKKERSFYDESDKSGSFTKYGKVARRFGGGKGGFVKGGHQAGGFRNSDYGAKGFQDRGRFADSAKGYNGRQGDDSYYKDFRDYVKKAGFEQQQIDEHDRR